MAASRYPQVMARQKVTLYLDPVVLQRMRAAARGKGMRNSELVEEALRDYLGMSSLERIWAKTSQSGLSDEEAMELAVEVVHEVRAERQRR